MNLVSFLWQDKEEFSWEVLLSFKLQVLASYLLFSGNKDKLYNNWFDTSRNVVAIMHVDFLNR